MPRAGSVSFGKWVSCLRRGRVETNACVIALVPAPLQNSMKEAKEKSKKVFGGLFGKVDMYGDKEGVTVYDGDNPKCFLDVKVRG